MKAAASVCVLVLLTPLLRQDRTDPPCTRGCDCALSAFAGGDDCLTRSVHPSGSDVGIDIFHLDGYEVVDHSRCDEGSFPDLDAHEDLGTTAICGGAFRTLFRELCWT